MNRVLRNNTSTQHVSATPLSLRRHHSLPIFPFSSPRPPSTVMALQAQWSLDATSNSVFSISRGLLQAATSDNVQPLAILACVKFGGTIAMCQETCRKIEGSVLPTPPPAFVHFIQGTVGYSRDDCATHLGKSMAGVQFLGLAAALVTTMGEFEAANALLLMMRGSAADKTLLPTTKQLRD